MTRAELGYIYSSPVLFPNDTQKTTSSVLYTLPTKQYILALNVAQLQTALLQYVHLQYSIYTVYAVYGTRKAVRYLIAQRTNCSVLYTYSYGT